MVMQMNRHHALARDALLRALSVFQGVTTADGNVGGTTLFCDALIGCNDFLTNKTILLESGLAIFEDSGATAFNPATGEITVSPAFSSRVLTGTSFYVLNGASGSGLIPIIGINQGLCYYGVVTAVPIAGQFTIASLAGLGAFKFIDTGLVNQYYAFVQRDASGPGAPPQGESQPITGYATLTGNFVANAFTVDVGIGDEILIIHPFLARIMNSAGLPPHEGSVAANWNTGVGTSGEAGEDLLGGASASPAIGAANTRYKLHSLLLDVSALTDGAILHVKLFMNIAGSETKIYDQQLTVPTTAAGETPPPDTNGLPIVNGTWVIHDLLRVEVHSSVNEIVAIGYTYILELM